MKNVLLIMLILFSTNCFGQEDIFRRNFSKLIKLSSIYYDENQNGKMEDNERLENIDGYVVFIYNYLDTIHNKLRVTININSILDFNKTYKDISFYTDNYSYMATDKYNNLLFVIMPTFLSNGSNIIFIYDTTMIKKILLG